MAEEPRNLMDELPPEEEEIPTTEHRDVTATIDFDDDEIEESKGIVWSQNVRLVLAICVVIFSGILVWWFVS